MQSSTVPTVRAFDIESIIILTLRTWFSGSGQLFHGVTNGMHYPPRVKSEHDPVGQACLL